MRGTMKGFITLFVVSFIIAIIHSCSLDNGILKPSCLIFEVDLDEKWWLPQDAAYHPIFFRSNGIVKVDGQTDTLSFVIENCNKLMVTNHNVGTEEQWVIKRITDVDLYLQYPDGSQIIYERKK